MFAWSSPNLVFAQPGLKCDGYAALNTFERIQFLEMSIGPRSEVSAQYLSEPGCGRAMLDALKGLGANIDYADEKSGFALVTIAREKLLASLDIAGIAYAFTRDDDRMYYQDPIAKIPQCQRKAEPVPTITIPYPRVATALAPDGPYFAADEIGLTELRRQHPEADGRGVHIAVADEGFDLLHPALQQAMDSMGNTLPKVSDLDTRTSPGEDSSWVLFGDPIQTTDGVFDAAGRRWIVPQDGTYRFGIFKQDLVLGPEDNSQTKKLALSVGVLLDESHQRIWVDTDGDGSFKNQRALGDFATTHDIDWFGTKTGTDDNRIPFGIKFDLVPNAVYIRIGESHGTLVGGPLAANRLTGGLFDGAAPNAQLIDSKTYRATYLAGLVEMFRRSDVDVINKSGGLGRAGYTGSQEGIEDFAQRVVERLISVYNKPIATFSAAVGTIHVNDYAGPEMLRRNRQVGGPYRDTINGGFPFLPNGLVNAVVAPSANLITASRYKPFVLTWPDGTRRSFDNRFEPPAPAGYDIGANNSPTIPVVSGVLADLISEANREHIRYNAVRLNNAVFTGTRLLDGIPLSQQGYGLINAANSWDQLAKMARADDPNNTELTSFTVTQIRDGQKVDVQGFHLDLPKPGEKTQGEIWITRHGGFAGGRKYKFSLRGDRGDYELVDQEATLERDKPVHVRFKTNGSSGWNIVLLELRDTKADVVMQDVPLSVRVPEVPEKMAPGVDKYEAALPPLTSENEYVRVGEDVQAARYVMKIPYTGPENISTRSFPGGHYRTTKTPPGEPVDATHHVGPLETLQSLVVNDTPGTQPIFWENRGRPEYATQYDGPAPDVSIHAELTVSKYAVAIAKNGTDTLNITNKLAEVEGHVELYDAKFATSELQGQGNHAMAETDFEMPANLSQWRARVKGAIAGAHADAYLFSCVGKNGCSIVVQQEITDKGASLVVDKPQAGTWKLVLRSREPVTGNPTFKLTEAQLTPTPTPAPAADTKHPSGATWTLPLPRTTRYAAFRIAGTPGVEREKDGLLIAWTPLDATAP
jgi:hypothetical protein